MPFKGRLVGFRILHLEAHIVIVHELLCMYNIYGAYNRHKIYNYMPIKRHN